MSYAAARSLAFYEQPLVQTLFWARLPGDTLIILGTAIYTTDPGFRRLRRPTRTASYSPRAIA